MIIVMINRWAANKKLFKSDTCHRFLRHDFTLHLLVLFDFIYSFYLFIYLLVFPTIQSSLRLRKKESAYQIFFSYLIIHFNTEFSSTGNSSFVHLLWNIQWDITSLNTFNSFIPRTSLLFVIYPSTHLNKCACSWMCVCWFTFYSSLIQPILIYLSLSFTLTHFHFSFFVYIYIYI